jgi:integrase
MKATRHANHGLRKVCDCPRRSWAKCPHGWQFNYKPKGGKPYRLSLDKVLGRHVALKSEAESAAAKLRAAIDDGSFGAEQPAVANLTLTQLLALYDKRYLQAERSASARNLGYQMKVIANTELPYPTGGTKPFGEWLAVDVSTDAIEQYREARRAAGLATCNRDLSFLRACFSWAVRVAVLERTPFKRNGEAVVRLARELPRSRRLQGDEAARLLAACGTSHLRWTVEAALETAMRRGEITSLQWAQVEGLDVSADGKTMTWGARPVIVITAVKAKTRTERKIPISTRLRAILEGLRLDPNAKPFGGNAYVFGNAVGEQVACFQRAWHRAILKANGVRPVYTGTANLTAECRKELERIDLHFHDLRREAASRWADAGIPLSIVQRWLGHSNVAQTSTYLSGTPAGEFEALQRYEAQRAVVQRCATEVGTGGQMPLPATTERERNPNETASDRQMTIM